jgi:hypothetical protein
MTLPANHYHVHRHSDDEDPFVTGDLFDAIDYAATELDQLADFEHDGISASGEQGDYESAYNAFVRSERYNGLMLNARNMVKQHSQPIAERAPFYTPDWEAGGEDAAQERLFESAKRTAGEINSGSPIAISECEAEMKTWPDTDQMHGGESYCADEYPDGYAGYQDGPCGDH